MYSAGKVNMRTGIFVDTDVVQPVDSFKTFMEARESVSALKYSACFDSVSARDANLAIS